MYVLNQAIAYIVVINVMVILSTVRYFWRREKFSLTYAKYLRVFLSFIIKIWYYLFLVSKVH